MRKLNVLSIVLIILVLGSWGIQIGIIAATRLTAENLSLEQMAFYGTLRMLTQIVTPLILNVIIGVWLFFYARKTTEIPWVWSLLGICFGLLAIVLIFCVDISKKLEKE